MREPGPPKPKVSILYICENADKTIEASIHSVFKQTYPNWSLLIVDCNSSDATLRLAQVLAANGPKQSILVLPYPSNDRKKIQFTLREHITGAYLFVLAQGDILQPSCIEELVLALESVPSAPFAYSAFIPYEGSVGSNQYFEAPSVSPGPFQVEKFLTSHHMPRSMLYRRSNRFIQIDFDQLYWPTDFCLQHYFLGQEPCYLGVPLVNQPADQTPGFSYYHISRMIARNRQHYPEHEVNWHAAISELWEDPAETITLVVVGNRQRFKDKNIREFIDQLSEQFRLAGQNYLFLGMDSEERELMAGVPLLPLSSESRSQIGERLAEVGSKLCVLVLEDSELIYLLNACPEVLFASLFTDRVDEAQRDAVLRFNSVISNQKIETLAQWENEADCFYDFGDSGKQVIQGKMLDYCRSQEAVTKSQSIVRQGQLKLVQNALSRDSIAISEPLDMSVILLAHDRTSSELARALRAWQYVDGSDRITFHAVPYGELHEAHELYRSQDIAVTELATTDLHARGYAANQGAQAIESEWLLFVDAQALPAPYLVMLLSHYTKLLRRTTCFYAKGTRLLPVDLPEAWAPESYYEWMHVGMCTWWHQADGALLIKRSLFEQLGGFSENYALWPYDFDDLLLRVSWLGEESIELPRGSILHPWSLSEVSGEAEQHNRNLLERTQAHPSPFAKKGLLPRPFNRIPRALRVSHEQSILQAVNDSNHQAELLFATAQALRADGHSYAAMECMQHAVFINPDDTRYVFELARIYMDRDQREAFERCFDRLMYLNPKDERLAEFPHKSELHG